MTYEIQVCPVNEEFGAKGMKVFCFAVVVGVLIATLCPFNPFPRNGVTWLRETNGLEFEGTGLVRSNGPLKPPNTEVESYGLELLLESASANSSGTILAFYTPSLKHLLVQQWKDGLLVTHDGTVEHDKSKTIKFDVDHIFRPGRLMLVTISSSLDGTIVYLDGQPVQSFPRFRISRSELSGEIVVGTSPTTYHPWQGRLCGLAVYSKELTSREVFQHYKDWNDRSDRPLKVDGVLARYGFTERVGYEVHNEVSSGPNLEIPNTFSVPHKGLLQSPRKEFSANWRYAKDVLMNIAGFVPLGAIVFVCLAGARGSWKMILTTTMACGILSFFIELLQYYIPRRGSGTTDIITNTLGAALGAILTQTGVARSVLGRITLNRGVEHSDTE